LRAGLAPGCGPQPLTWRGCIRFPADRIHKAVVEALVPGTLAVPVGGSTGGEEGGEWEWRYAFTAGGRRDRLEGAIGFRRAPREDLARLLERNPALAIKAHYALWARAFAENDASPGAPTRITLSQFCDDLGYARLENGAHRPE